MHVLDGESRRHTVHRLRSCNAGNRAFLDVIIYCMFVLDQLMIFDSSASKCSSLTPFFHTMAPVEGVCLRSAASPGCESIQLSKELYKC